MNVMMHGTGGGGGDAREREREGVGERPRPLDTAADEKNKMRKERVNASSSVWKKR